MSTQPQLTERLGLVAAAKSQCILSTLSTVGQAVAFGPSEFEAWYGTSEDLLQQSLHHLINLTPSEMVSKAPLLLQ